MTPPSLTSSVLIASFRRPALLCQCLQSLATQTQLPDEVIVVWQADDIPTRDAVQALMPALPYRLRLLHSAEAGVVSAENLALEAATAEIVLLCDDDVVVPPTWIARHLSFYVDPCIGAVGGSANNHFSDGSSFPKRAVEPLGRLTWYGRSYGNMYDQIEAWQSRDAIECDHLVGYNFSLRRSALHRFEFALKPYWQLFELDACLQVKANGYRVKFDFANVVEHYPTNKSYTGGRDGDLQIKIFNAAYNQGLILAKHSSKFLAVWRFLYLILVGSRNAPGLVGGLLALYQYRNPRQEIGVVWNVWTHTIAGWIVGMRLRRSRSAGVP